MRNNFIIIPANLIGLAKAAAGPAGGTGSPTGTGTGATSTGGGTGTTGSTGATGVTASTGSTGSAGSAGGSTGGSPSMHGYGDDPDMRALKVQSVNNEVTGGSPLDAPVEYDPDGHADAEQKLREMQENPDAYDPEAIQEQQAIVKEHQRKQHIEAQRLQSARNTDDGTIDWRPVDWENSGLSGNLTVVRGTRLTPAQYGYYQRRVKAYGGDKNKAWQDVQARFSEAAGRGHQMWVQTDEDKALQAQNQRALSQPPSGQWYRSYGDDAQLGPGNTIRVKGAPSPALQRSAQARGMTIVSDARYYGNQGNWNRAADARRAAQYQNRVNAQQYSQVPQPQNNRGKVAPLGGWGDKNFDSRLVSNLESLASSNSATPMISYLVRNAGQIHNWLNENYNTPTGQKVIDALFKYSGAMNDVKNSWAKMTPAQQLQLKRNAAYTVLKSYFGNSLWSSEGQRPTESMAGMPVGANFAGAAIRGRS